MQTTRTLAWAFIAALASTPASADQVTVFAASSLTEAMAEIEKVFEAATGHDLVVSLAGSSVLARQIEQGAPADVYISASTEWMDHLEARELIDPATRLDFAGNALVLVAHGRDAPSVTLDADTDLRALLGGGRLAMALVEAVPAGIYGKSALVSLGLWDDVADRVAETDNVRTALVLVASGEAPFGIVYATDAMAEKAVVAVATFPAGSHPPIVYPAAGVRGRDSAARTSFLAFLRGPETQAILARLGFRPGAD